MTVSKINKSGVTRKVDELGRIVLPIDMRRSLDLKSGDDVVLSCEGSEITIIKKASACYICGSREELLETSVGLLCNDCRENLKKELFEH